MDKCEVEETEDLNGREWCFSIKTSGGDGGSSSSSSKGGGTRTRYFSAPSQQERTNWIVTILRLKQPAELIGLLEHPKLSRRAAVALIQRLAFKSRVSVTIRNTSINHEV